MVQCFYCFTRILHLFSDFRSNINYKRFIKSFSSWSPYGGGDYGTTLTIGPNLSFGRRTMFTKRLFLDFAFNYSVYNQIKERRSIDLESNNVQFTTRDLLEIGALYDYKKYTVLF